MAVYLTFLVGSNVMLLCSLYHQYSIIKDEAGCREKFYSKDSEPLIKELYKIEQVEKSDKY